MVELAKVEGVFSKGQASNKVLQDKMYVPEFLFNKINSILPLDATHTSNNNKYSTELNLHTIYPALFLRQTKESLPNLMILDKKSKFMVSESFYPGM